MFPLLIQKLAAIRMKTLLTIYPVSHFPGSCLKHHRPLAHMSDSRLPIVSAVEQSLQTLRGVETDIGRLSLSVLSVLPSLGSPAGRTDAFPLRTSVAAGRALRTRLEHQ